MEILASKTSCDEVSAAIVKEGKKPHLEIKAYPSYGVSTTIKDE